MSRHIWSPAEISDASGPGSNVRNYLEQRDVRRCLSVAALERPIESAGDVGCGYGRLTMVLAEFASSVVGFEREPGLVDIARSLLPTVRFAQVASLARLPEPSASFDFVMSFTVVQHMRDSEAQAVLAEIKRLARGRYALLVEETDPDFQDGDPKTDAEGVTTGRAVETYRTWMDPFDLVLQFPRQIEPGYVRHNVGSYMLFRDTATAGDSRLGT